MKKFKKIYIEITNVCNLSCSFCPKTERKSSFMSYEYFERILKEISPFTDYIYLHVKGEPLLHPMLGEFLNACEEYGLKVNITTNGTLIKKTITELKGKKTLRQVNFSLHSFGGENGDKESCRSNEISSTKDYLGDIMEGVEELLQTTSANISYRFWNMDKTTDVQVPSFKTNTTDHYLQRIETVYGYPGSLKIDVKPGRGIKISDRIYISRDFEFTWPALTEEEDNGVGFCYGLRTHVGILADGTVIPCCLDGEGVISLGNIITEPFADIISNDRAMVIYNGFSGRRAVEELCRKCGYRKKFGKL